MRKSFYYGGGALCLVMAAMLLLSTSIVPVNIGNDVSRVKIDNRYREYYDISFVMPKNSLKQGTVWLPVYSVREREHLWQVILPFAMGDAEIVEHDEYFEAVADGETLRIYRFIDLLEYENLQGEKAGKLIDDGAARKIAEEFLEEFLPRKQPYDVSVGHKGDNWVVRFEGHLSSLPNAAFPTEITLDAYGNIIEVSHFFFEYEALGTADVITVKAALAQLPREHEGKVDLKRFDLMYCFEDSVLVPVYRFYGEYGCGACFEECVKALRFY
ncbi:MAG: hypothetical protein FWC76_02030 [Defluviitaleaceae bacterium]|nr:hypothetical protein [Defluviitaleaceae bacterium]